MCGSDELLSVAVHDFERVMVISPVGVRIREAILTSVPA